MIQIPEAMRSYWNRAGNPKATSADIARIERTIGVSLPPPYINFVTQFGFVSFDDVPGMRRLFDYLVIHHDRAEKREGDISFMLEPDRVIEAHERLTTPRPEYCETLPKFPANFLPVGNDAGQGQILLELGKNMGRVWYWPENEWAWGLEDNTKLGLVAEDFHSFINELRP